MKLVPHNLVQAIHVLKQPLWLGCVKPDPKVERMYTLFYENRRSQSLRMQTLRKGAKVIDGDCVFHFIVSYVRHKSLCKKSQHVVLIERKQRIQMLKHFPWLVYHYINTTTCFFFFFLIVHWKLAVAITVKTLISNSTTDLTPLFKQTNNSFKSER